MEKTSIYQDIAKRTDGDIYIGVVGPVRTGKSTFVKRFMETMVLPNIENENRRERANDELPQSAAGKTIMTTEPKFIPEEAVRIDVDDTASFNVRMIDCVGYIVPSALGYIENEQPRMVVTPWFDREIPFNMAAEIGTKKVITEHSTIGLVVTTDGSISDIARDEYEEAEERVINELKSIDKPFLILLNATDPDSPKVRKLRAELEEKYGVPVVAVSCLELDEEDIRDILAKMLYQFPVKEAALEIAPWIMNLEKGHWLKDSIYTQARQVAQGLGTAWATPPRPSATWRTATTSGRSGWTTSTLAPAASAAAWRWTPSFSTASWARAPALTSKARRRCCPAWWTWPKPSGSTTASRAPWRRCRPPATALSCPAWMS